MKLYEISDTYQQFLSAVENGDIPEEAVLDTLEGIQGEFNEKADNIACCIKNLKAEAEAIKAERDTLDERAKSKLSKAESLRNYLSVAMQNTGITKIETARNSLTFRRSSSLFIADENDFKQRHADLCKKEIKVTIPRTEITKMIKAGEDITGAELRTNQNLQIK